MLKQLILVSLIIFIPLATLVLAAVYHFSPAYLNNSYFGGFPALLTAFSSLCAIYCVCLIALAFFINDRNKALSAKNQAAAKGHEDLARENKTLSAKVDLLSATREISLIITHEVDFQKILGKSLEIIAQMINPKESGSEITLFLKDEISGRLSPQAQRKGAAIVFEDDLSNQLDWRNVNESLEHSRLFFSADGEMLDFTIPLVADRDTVGVLKAKIPAGAVASYAESQPPPVGGNKLRPDNFGEDYIKHMQDNLMELARVLALAVKTPMLYNRAITDGLTGLYTKRHLFNELPVYMEISRRHDTKLSFVMFDIDHFKKVNDTYGHLTGDAVLKGVSETLKATLRATSTAYRYGGEEIAIILPLSSRDDAKVFAERLRKKIESQSFASQSGQKLKVTISLGAAEYSPKMADFKELISQADTALYRAKQGGRNQTIVI
ncbi:MAG: GGDEF domain-containing protein [Planctomycetes bacterium]|nr:GGDEF domain-containing protein [Planctomycetota bacterium]